MLVMRGEWRSRPSADGRRAMPALRRIGQDVGGVWIITESGLAGYPIVVANEPCYMVVFTVDYALDPDNIAWVYEMARGLGFVPFVSNRALGRYVPPVL